jgi:hypothetical protein
LDARPIPPVVIVTPNENMDRDVHAPLAARAVSRLERNEVPGITKEALRRAQSYALKRANREVDVLAFPQPRRSDMKTRYGILAVAALMLGMAPALAQNTGADSSGQMQHGQVTGLDKSGQITVKLSSGETRTFHPQDGLEVNALKPGDEIRFSTVAVNGKEEMTKVTKE